MTTNFDYDRVDWLLEDKWFEEQGDPKAEVELGHFVERLTDGELALFYILTDRSGVDIVEFAWHDDAQKPGEHGGDGCYRLWPFQWSWWRHPAPRSVDQGSRSIGKSESIAAAAAAFPFNYPQQEMVIAAPEGTHVDAICDRIEMRYENTRLLREMLVRGRGGIKHKPFKALFGNGSRVFARLPQRSGVGMKGCVANGTLVLVRGQGLIPVETVREGDEVWTHLNRWRPVQEHQRFIDTTWRVSGAGALPVEVTENHAFLGVWDDEDDELSWAHVDELDIDSGWRFLRAGPGAGAFATGYEPVTYAGGLDPEDTSTWEAVGWYAATGTCPFPAGDELDTWLTNDVGHGIPPWLYTAAPHIRRGFLDGYIEAAGRPYGFERHTVTTGDPRISTGLALIAQGLGRTTLICDRRVTISDSDEGRHEDGYAFHAVRQPIHVGDQEVHNLITEDHSYLANGVYHHNTHPAVLHVDECLGKGTLVLCRRGLIPIEDVEVGDQVLTHRRRWRKVTATATRQRPSVRMKGFGHPGLTASANHPFLAATKDDRRLERVDERLVENRNIFSEPQWVPAGESEGSYWATPTAVEKIGVPSFVGPGPRGKAEIPCENATPEFMWCVGQWAAEGSAQKDKATWSVHVDEVSETVRRLEGAGLHCWTSPVATSTSCVNVVVASTLLSAWLVKHFGRGAHNKTIPAWLLGAPENLRRAFFDGLLFGDGYYTGVLEGEWKLTTVSKKLAIGTRILATTLGLDASIYWSDTSKRDIEIRGRKTKSEGFYQLVGRDNTRSNFTFQNMRFAPIRSVEPTGKLEELYDLTVEEDESFVADGFITHNSQDVTERAWKEIPEVVRFGEVEGAMLKAHGVSKGVRDDAFWKMTQPNSGFHVHRYSAMHRPSWTAEERAQKISEYGSVDSPDFKRNVYGVHGDSSNRIFLLRNIMRGVDEELGSEYNEYDYFKVKIRGDDISSAAKEEDPSLELEAASDAHTRAIQTILQFPDQHTTKYSTFWIGMDVGLVADPTEMCIFAEYVPNTEERGYLKRQKLAIPAPGDTTFKLLTRISMVEIPTPLQADAVMWAIAHYAPKVFAMDAGGNGLPLFQELQKRAGSSRHVQVVEADGPEKELQEKAKKALTTIRGYKFGSKVPVEIDEEKAALLGAAGPLEVIEKAGIYQETKTRATDVLREWVNTQRLLLPYDTEVTNSLNGQTQSYSAEPIDAYGKRRSVYSMGQFHILDAFRFFALGRSQLWVEDLIASAQDIAEPVFVSFGLD